jgi:CRISPR/Cas system Type II protein with McrA/HNH and RuvC-like nuclease domain
MIAYAWYPLIEYKLNFGAVDQLNNIVTLIYNKYNRGFNLDSATTEDNILKFLDSIHDREIEDIIVKYIYRYVPTRLLSPFFSEMLKGIKDYDKDGVIEHLSQINDDVLYMVNTLEKQIYVNDNWFDYIIKNQSIINGWLNYKIIYFLQKRNPNVPAIPFKLKPPLKRDLSIAKKLLNGVLKEIEVKDIYTNKEFNINNFTRLGEISIDHFIPWSFVQHDELWNLIPTFKSINSSKGNRLPEYNKYIDSFCDFQYKAFNIIISNRSNSKYLIDYININKKLKLDSKLYYNLSENDFKNSIKSAISPLYQIAYNQGYDIWNNNIY